MPRDDRNVLEVLKAELNFVTKGGYGRSPREPWRAQLFLEDSPTCMNYDRKESPAPCSECLLIDFVPDDRRNEKVPCRHIRLTPDGETLLQLYRRGTECEITEAMENWLRKAIDQLESSGKTETPPLRTNQCACDSSPK